MHNENNGMIWRTIKSFKLISIASILAIVSLLLVSIPFFTINIKISEVKLIGATELTWEDATSHCDTEAGDWTLPSMYQLAAIYYLRSDIELIEHTDYWTRNSFAGYAFGLNTRLGIPSFDKHTDTDHVICIKNDQ